MKRIALTIMIVLALTLMLVGSACNEGEGIITADSDMQEAMKMVPDEWNIFCYLDAKEMRSDVSEPAGLEDLWNWGTGYLESLSEAEEIDPEQWPLSMDSIDYMAIAAGSAAGLQQYNGSSVVFIIGGTFSLTAVSSYFENFDTNYPDTGASFTEGTYNGVETWAPDADVLIALTTGSSVALVGDTSGVKDCIDAIKGAGDDDSMLGNEGVKEIAGLIGDAAFAMIIDGDEDIPEETYPDAPDYPEAFEGTLGYGISRVGDKLKLRLFAEMSDSGQWLQFLADNLPDEGYLPYYFGGGDYDSRSADEARKTEKANISLAVASMMLDAEIGSIPNPVTGSSNATRDMSMFPDVLSDNTGGDKLLDPDGDAYDFTAGDKKGYRLWNHDNTADSGVTVLERYVVAAYTTYYYSIDEDTTLHQYDYPGGTEYLD